MLSRRKLIKSAGQIGIGASCVPLANALTPSGSIRCINVVNFIRGVEPRGPVVLLLPVQKQMELILEHRLPATWLPQFDALVSGPFVEFLRRNIKPNHEVGFWFEMNEMHCKAAGVEWRGRPGYEWDSYPFVAFTIGYTPEERIKLADAAMRTFKSVWGRYPSSVASWNLDAITVAHLSEHYRVDAFAVCRDQIATDGFTIWGAPIAGYYPSKTNCWSPGLDRKSQISTPIFRMLGQDPVYYYDNGFKLPGGSRIGEPDTMEPVWTAGRTPRFVEQFLHMIAEAPTLQFGYAQLGQENSFGWPEMAQAYPAQMKALAALRDAGSVHVETMGESGRRFKRTFATTPAQAQIMLDDPFGNTDPAEGSIWYQSRFYRANLHIKGDLPYLRDLTVYSDRNPQPFLDHPTRSHEVEQRMPAVLDGYRWKDPSGTAGGFFELEGQPLRLTAKPTVQEQGQTLLVTLPVGNSRTLQARFEERQLTLTLSPKSASPFSLTFKWDPTKSPQIELTPTQVKYRQETFDYSVQVTAGHPQSSALGWSLVSTDSELGLLLAQSV